LFLVFIALASFQTVLVSSRQRLDDLERQVAAQQDRYQDLTVDVARLESPDRILTAARDRLGMVPAGEPVYVTPSGDVVADALVREADAAAADEGGDAESAPDDVAADPLPTAPPATAWPDVKPYLEPAP
jgi:cell division protein FtsL